MNNNDLQVSVCIVTYNQENYIAECLESIVTQQTNFKFEVIVGEDCSTDNTRAIIQEYVKKYPELIIPIFHEKNVGVVENIRQIYIAAKGKYIAHIDGDDMALSNKLQKQFDVLEANPDCNVCSHDVKQINLEGTLKKISWTYPTGEYDLFELYKKLPFFAHSSKMFRNKYAKDFWNDLLSEPYILDLDIHIANVIDGKIYHIDDFLGLYRVGSGVSNRNCKVNKLLPLGAIRIFEKGLIFFENDEAKLSVIRDLYAIAMLQCAYNYAVYDKDIELFKTYVNKSIKCSNIGIKQKVFEIGKIFPSAFFVLCSLRYKIRQ